MDWLEYENKNIARGFLNICGVDEAGRGPLAGPVCAAAVILPENTVIEGVNDSKKLSEKKREALFDVIKEQALAYCIAFASVEEIENIHFLNFFNACKCNAVCQCLFLYYIKRSLSLFFRKLF